MPTLGGRAGFARAAVSAGLAAAAAFAALAGLVAGGAMNGIDEWAVNHAMPGARFTGGKSSLVDAVIPLHHVHWHGAVHITAELVTLPAAFMTATVLLALCCLRLGGRRAAALAAVYVLANVIEELTKLTLTRPPLHHGRLHLAALDSSYPSGHTIRAVLVAAGVALAWPALRLLTRVWAASAVVMLEVGGFHVPSDIAGGLLLATALLAAATWASPSGPSRACRPSSRAR
jgi:membrane-associated phospholipid phosphatase